MFEVNSIIHGDCLEVMRGFPDNCVDSVVTDPPYGISFMGKKWDIQVPGIEIWQEVFRILKPGGHMLVFGGARTYHRLVCGIEDAGFEIMPMCGWLFGSGFPKSLNIGVAVDRILGNEREIVGKKEGTYADIRRDENSGQDSLHGGKKAKERPRVEVMVTKGTSKWEGFGTGLKPALEPICMCRKPISEKTIAANVLKWNTGGINIDGCRIGTEKRVNRPAGNKAGGNSLMMSKIGMPQDAKETNAQGRFPANLILDDSKCVRDLFPDSKSTANVGHNKASENTCMSGANLGHTSYGHNDSGSAARFFYIAKPSKREKAKYNKHATVKPVALMKYLIRLVTPPKGITIDPFAGSGTSCVAAIEEGFKYIGIEQDEESVKTARQRITQAQPNLF